MEAIVLEIKSTFPAMIGKFIAFSLVIVSPRNKAVNRASSIGGVITSS